MQYSKKIVLKYLCIVTYNIGVIKSENHYIYEKNIYTYVNVINVCNGRYKMVYNHTQF